MPLRDREFEREVNEFISSRPFESIFRLDWIPDSFSWFISAIRLVHGHRVLAYKYLLGVDTLEAIEWIEWVEKDILKPHAMPVVLVDTKPLGVRVDHHDHCWVTDNGFEPVKGRGGK